MFGSSYFGNRFYGPSYFGPGKPFTGGGPMDKKRRRLSEQEIEGLKAIYPTYEFPEEVEYEVTTQEFEQEQVIDIAALEEATIQYGRLFTLTSEQKREILQDTDDIGLILAIIETLD